MNIFKLIAIVVILAGTQGLVYGSYYHINADRETIIDVTELLTHEDPSVSTPIWAGLGAITAGTVLFLYGVKHRRPTKQRPLLDKRRPSPATNAPTPHFRQPLRTRPQ